MAVFRLGAVIRSRREELGLSQEELADGICSVPTLSRIENGERMPTRSHFEMLMQRLGYSARNMDFFMDNRDFQAHELKFRIRHAYMEKDFSQVRTYLEEYEAISRQDSPADQQFLALYDTLLNQKKSTNQEKLDRLGAALALTCPKYIEGKIPAVLTYEEIILLNNVAICYDRRGERTKAIGIFLQLREFYRRKMISSEEAQRTQTMILYNLSKVLGLDGKYDECIEVCKQGVHLARTTGRCLYLSLLLLNHSWALLHRNQPGDWEEGRELAKQACCAAYFMGDAGDLAELKEYYRESFGEWENAPF